MFGKKLAALLLAGAAVLTSAAPAGAISPADAGMMITVKTARAAAQRAVDKATGGSSAPAQTGTTLSFQSVESRVRANNANIKSFEKTLQSISSTDITSQFINQYTSYDSQNAALESQAKQYERSAKELRNAADEADGATKDSLIVQAKQMEKLAQQARASIAANNAVMDHLGSAEDDAQDDLDDTYNTTKKQLDNSANLIVYGAQTQYITLCTLQDNVTTLERNIAALDRQIPVVEKQVEIGLATQLDLKTIRNQRTAAVSGKATLESQISALENSLSLTLGNAADTTVHVQSLPEVGERDLVRMNYIDDLAEVKKNSYAIWEKQDAVRQAGNDYEDNKSATLDAYNAAKINLANTQEEVENSFRKLYTDVSDKKRLLEDAQDDLTLAQTNYTIAETKYKQGMISKLAYDTAGDTLKTAEEAVKTAKTDLFTSYNTYSWAKRGMMN